MCGIAGILSYSRQADTLDAIDGMTGVLQHRGPDGEGLYLDDKVAFGHRRLSIVDSSDSGSQPFHNEDRSLILVFNGEIYNYQELRDALKRKGHRFHGASDGEVILHLYEDEGFDCLTHLEGMFAFALYDKVKQQLFIARDRIGEKPLYYLNTPEGFYFSSEIKSFLMIPNFEPKLSDRAVLNYFLHTQVPAPYCIYEGISKLVPAHYLVVDGKGDITHRPYWRINYRNKQSWGLIKATEKLREFLDRAISKCMLSDYPVGVLLSGGIDSSTVLALARNSQPQPEKVFTLAGPSGQAEDPELNRAERIAKLHGVDQHTYHFDDIDFDRLTQAIAKFDEPVGIPDIIYNFYFNSFVAKHVKVALTGNGADEIFGGYRPYTTLRRNTLLSQKLLTVLPFRRRLIDWMTIRTLNRKNRRQARQLFSDHMIDRTQNLDVRNYLQHYFPIAEYDEILDARLFLDLFVTLNHSASLADTTGMASSLELRSPYLNHRLIEFAATLPTSFKIKSLRDHRQNKYILKKVSECLMPSDMVFLDKYRCGQFIDIPKMLKTTWRPQVEALLLGSQSNIPDIFCHSKLLALWRAYLRDNSVVDPFFIMKLVIFLVWHRYTFAQAKQT